MEYRFKLEKYTGRKSRFTCPSCGAKYSFTRYVDIETNEYLSDDIGICNREVKCAYHRTPKEYFNKNNLPFVNEKVKRVTKPKPIDFINPKYVSETLSNYDNNNNNFVQFLYSTFEKSEVEAVISKYKIGTHNTWNGAVVFWQIDADYKVRTGKVMLYNRQNAKRIKKPFPHVNWFHSILIKLGVLPEYNLSQCFFGEHFLKKNTTDNIAIVEAEKTAIICSIFFPEMIWLASGGLSNLNSVKVQVLKKRNVTLFPDNGAYKKWKTKADKFGFNISTLLEEKGSKGQDLADYLLAHKKLSKQ